MLTFLQIEIILCLILAAVTCAIVGTFVQLKNDSTLTDTASRSALLGIAMAFTATVFQSSWILLSLSCVAAVLAIMFVETLYKNNTLTTNASSVITYSFTLSIGVVLMNYFSSLTHINIGSVYTGQLVFIPYERFIFEGYDLGPIFFYKMLATLVINIITIVVFYKQLKLVIVDSVYANSISIRSKRIDFIIVILVAITVASSFQIFGVMFATIFFILPAATAQFFTKKLSTLILASSVISIVACLTGFNFCVSLDVSVIAVTAIVLGIMFIFALVFAPEKGALQRYLERKDKYLELYNNIVLIHLLQHEKDVDANIENNIKKIAHHLNWRQKTIENIIATLKKLNCVEVVGDMIVLTDNGRAEAKKVLGV